MVITEASMMHHVCIVLFALWLLSRLNWCGPVAYFVSLIYLYLVHEIFIMRLSRKLQFEEKKKSNQRRVLTDSESVRWLNHAVEKIWPICMEQIASQKILRPIIPWFLEKYRPWTAKNALIQHLYLGRSPPIFTEMRVLRQCPDDDHLVLELGMNFLTADDMSAILAVQLRKRLGFGMWAKLHLTGMNVEGKVLIGVKFLPRWPFLGRLRVCFAEPPYFQMTVKPIFTHGMNVTELPGIAGWLDNLLSVAFEETLVEPNMLVVDLDKFAGSPQQESWFSIVVKDPVAYAKVEVIEASDMKPSDLNGLADPYVKVQLGPCRFRTKIEKKTLAPKWFEEFKIPIRTWESPNILSFEVRDKDPFLDDALGKYSVNVNDLRDGLRHDTWVPLEDIKMGRLHIAITILEGGGKVSLEQEDAHQLNAEPSAEETKRNSFATDTTNKDSFSSLSSAKSLAVADHFEPIDIEGQKETGIWIQQPGSEVLQTWEHRKGKSRRADTEIQREPDASDTITSPTTESARKGEHSTKEDQDDKQHLNAIKQGLHKIGSVFQRTSKREDELDMSQEFVESPHTNLQSINSKKMGVNLIVEEEVLAWPASARAPEGRGSSPKRHSPESPRDLKDKAKNIFKQAEKSARAIRNVLSRKGSRKFQGDSSTVAARSGSSQSESSDAESPSSSHSLGSTVIKSQSIALGGTSDNPASKDNKVATESKEHATETGNLPKDTNRQGLGRREDEKLTSLNGSAGDELVECTPKTVSVPETIPEENVG